MELEHIGWDGDRADGMEAMRAAATSGTARGWWPARVCTRSSERCTVWGADGEREAVISGHLRDAAVTAAELPAVGDWVALEGSADDAPLWIRAVLPRRTCFSRRGAGRTAAEQVLAANVDVALLVSGLDRDFNVRRIERYLVLACSSGATPVIVLNKADVCDDVDARRREVAEIAGDAAVHVTSARDPASMEALRRYAGSGRTLVLLGSSGVGKSTITNALVGDERQEVRSVRADDQRGRHTTTAREMIALPGGGVVIDTPGLREVQLWVDDVALHRGFADVSDLAAACRFRDCGHDGEPGCAVLAAVEAGALDRARLESFLNLRLEVRALEARGTEKGRREQRARARQQGRLYKRIQRNKRRGR